jgi:hypothetical protein
MSPRAVVVAVLVVVGGAGLSTDPVRAQDTDDGCCIRGVDGPPPSPIPGAGAGGGRDSYISSWVIGVAGGGVRAPGGSVCTPWRHAAEITAEVTVADLASVGVDPDGVRRNLYFRDCGTQRQLVWVRNEPPVTVAAIALSDLQRRLITAPVPDLSPPAIGYVNIETWLATAEPGDQTATAAIPGLSVTVTATVVSTTWSTGDGDDEIVCEGVGVAWTPGTPDDEAAPCGHTYTAHGAPVYGSAPFTITVAHSWRVTWQATDGTVGDLGTITGPTTTITYEVREIQTIGIQG